MAGHRVAHATLKGPSVVKELIIGMALGLAAGGLWKMHHWNEQRKTRAFYDLLERGEISVIAAEEKKNLPFLLIDFSSYLGVPVYVLGSVYLQLCKEAFSMDNYDQELVDPSTFIPRFTNDLPETKWIICGAAIYIAALSHDIADMGEETITYILNESEAASLTVSYLRTVTKSSLKFLLLSVCLSEESEASDESDNLSDLDGDPVEVAGIRPDDCALACNRCGRILENFYFSEEVTFIKNAAGQSQASGNIVSSVQSGIPSSRARRSRIARDELMNFRDALQIGEDRDDVVNMASRLFDMAADQNFTKGRRSELVLSSCLYLACRKKELAVLLIDFSSYLRVSVYELGSVYLQLCELFFMVDNPNREDLEELVDPSIFIERFTKSAHDKQTITKVIETTKNIIASMKRDWMQTGRKPSGICGAAIYIAALSRGIMCSTTDIAHIVHMCGATITKRLNEFANTEAASLTVEELDKSEESILLEKPFTPRPNSDKEVVNCKHKDSESFGYGLCRDCHEKFMKVSGGVVGGSDPPAFQRAEKERMEKAAREENEGGIEKSVRGETYWNAEDSDESDNLSDLDGDPVVDGCFLDEDEKRAVKKSWEFLNAEWLKEQAAKEAALKTASDAFNASNANCPEYARNLVEASKASVSKSRKEKRQKRAEEAKNAPPAATALEACTRVLESKKLIKHFNPDRLKELFNPDRLKELFDTSSGEKSPKKSRTETVIENKKEVEIEEEKDEEEDEEEPYEMYAEEKFYEDQVEEEEEEEEDGYDFGL
ncbi:hypothetical protein YC2023_048057 [Brassica napus]